MNVIGLLYLFLIFLFSFAVVHILKLALVGFLSLKKQPPEEEEKKPEPKPEKKPEPVYYIVEKKRTKKSYSKPKEIQFKK